jgi:general secretion pathway protein C
MKRLPLIFSFLSTIMLSLSCAFWGVPMLKAPLRNAANYAPQENVEPSPGQWGNLFGSSQAMQDTASKYQLKGVVVAQSVQDSAAIVSVNGKPAQSLHVNQELTNGVTLNEVHETYIVIREAGVEKRIDLSLSADVQVLMQADENQGNASVQKSFSFASRQRRAAIPIPESSLAETPLRPARLEQQNSGSELPTASYPSTKK